VKNYYSILQVSVDSDAAEIRESYRRLVQENLWNKDVFAELKEAYEALSTPGRRQEYDRSLLADNAGTSGAKSAEYQQSAVSEFGRRCPMGTSKQCPVVSGAPLRDTFCPECGADLAALPQLGVTPEEPMDVKWFGRLEEETGRRHRLRIGESVVGREGAEVTLPDKTISRVHAKLMVGEDNSVLEDMGSTNGTQVNGERMSPNMPRTLVDGDTVRFGSVRMRFRAVDSTSEPADLDISEVTPLDLSPVVPIIAAQEPVLSPISSIMDSQIPEPPALNPLERLFRAPLGTAVNARAKLVATRGDMISEHPLIDGVTSFGRRADSTIVLRNDPYVSGSHAQIIGEGDVFKLEDVGSTNGTLLNGERLEANQPIALSQSDEIVIGGTIFRFEMNVTDALPG
jgi:pSer/pThr/pTyr-binding forkhead associated (FHA) protein